LQPDAKAGMAAEGTNVASPLSSSLGLWIESNPKLNLETAADLETAVEQHFLKLNIWF
jgi:hypothetical protein